MTFSLRFERNPSTNRLLVVAGSAAQVHMGSFNINLHFSEFLCKIADVIVDIFKRLIEKLVEKKVDELGGKLEAAVVAAMQKVFDKLPLELTGEPAVQNDVLALPIDLDSLLKSVKQQIQQQQVAALRQPPMLHSKQKRLLGKVGGAFVPQRDVSIVLPQSSVNTFLRELDVLGKLGPFAFTVDKLTTKLFELFLPGAYAACPDCPLNLAIDFPLPAAPQLLFGQDNVTLAITNMTLGFRAVNLSTSAIIPLFEVGMHAALGVYNFSVGKNATTGLPGSVLKFDLTASKNAISLTPISSNVGPISTLVGILDAVISAVVNVFIPTFNNDFKGIGLPDLGGIALDRLLVQVIPGTMTAGVNLIL